MIFLLKKKLEIVMISKELSRLLGWIITIISGKISVETRLFLILFQNV